jgi:CBS domain containing-hemolysin-like protein
VDYRGFSIEVLDAERKRVQRVRFRRKPEAGA